MCGLTRQDLTESKWTEKDKSEIKEVLDRYMWNDTWIAKLKKPVAILLTSHPGNRAFLKASVESHKKLGYWICLAYDNYLHLDMPEIDYNSIMPPKDVMDDIDLFFQTTYQQWGGVLFPWFWAMKWGVNALQDFEYIYSANGDFVLEKPEGFEELFKMLGDADIMTSGPDRDSPPTANTAGFIAKTGALKAIMKHFEEHFVPFDIYEKYTQEYGNAEGRFGRAIKDLGLKQVRVTPPPEDMLKIPGTGTWYDKVGFRHIHAELNYAYRSKKIPPHYKYLDKRYCGGDYNVVKEYWDTKDIKVLEKWWCD